MLYLPTEAVRANYQFWKTRNWDAMRKALNDFHELTDWMNSDELYYCVCINHIYHP